MKMLGEFWQSELLRIGNFSLECGMLLSLILLVLAAVFIFRGFRALMKRYVFSRLEVAPEKQQIIYRVVAYILAISSFGMSLAIVGVNIRAFLDALETFLRYPLLTFGDPEAKEGTQSINVIRLLLVGSFLLLARIGVWSAQALLNKSTIGRRIEIDQGRRQAILQIFRYLIYLLAGILIFSSLGFNVSVLIAGSAALIVVVGFGLQNIFHDVLSGILILFEGSVEVGDVIQHGENYGRVKVIRLRSTEIETPDGIVLIIPNSKLTGDTIINWSHNKRKTRFDLEVGVAYGSDIEKVRTTLLACAERHTTIAKKPAPKVFFADFGDSALIFQLRFWTNIYLDIEQLKSELRYDIDASFRKEEISIPFPQRDVHLKK